MLFDQIELLCVLFLVLIHDLVLVLKPLCEQHSFSCHERYKQAYCILQLYSFQVKMVNHYEDYTNFLDIQHLLQENIPYYYLHHNFYEVFVKLRQLFYPFKKPFTGSF